MGWSSRYYGYAPKGKARIEAIINDEGLNAETEERKWEVLDSALRGTTAYFACRITNKQTGETKVFATVALTAMDKGWFAIKLMDETCGPYSYDCPKRILDLLDPPSNDWAKEWRQKCEERRQNKDELSTLPLGTKVKLKNYAQPGDWIITVCKYRGRRAYIDWLHSTKFTPRSIRSWGYTIYEEENK